MIRKIVVTLLFTGFYLSPVAAAELTGTLQQIKKSGEIKIGFRENEPPMSFVGSEGKPVGYSIDICSRIVTAVKEKVGTEVKVKYVPVTAQNRFSALTENKIDILCGSTTKTLARGEIVDFTQLTFITGAALMTLKSSNFRELANLNGKKIGVVKNTTTVKVLNKLLKDSLTDAKVVEVDTASQGMEKLRSGAIAAFSADQIVLIGLVVTSKDAAKFEVSTDVFSYEPFALAVRRNDADFRLVADRAISQLYRTGQIVPIYDKWFAAFAKQRPKILDALFLINATPEG